MVYAKELYTFEPDVAPATFIAPAMGLINSDCVKEKSILRASASSFAQIPTTTAVVDTLKPFVNKNDFTKFLIIQMY